MRVINKGRYCKCGKPAYCKRQCRACHNAAYRKANPAKVKAARERWQKAHPAYQREWARHRRSNCSPEQSREALQAQEGCCALCHKPMHEEPRADHNHTTGKFRALLHERCNLALGGFKEDITLLSQAIAYLQKFK